MLTAVIKESLRMYTPVILPIARCAVVDYQYKDIVIPKGTGVFIGVPTIHMNHETWPEPEKFDPSRFLVDYDKNSYLAFGAGPKNCIGLRLGYSSLSLLIAELLVCYKLVPGPSSTIGWLPTSENFFTLIPENDIYCKLEPCTE